MVLGLLGAGLQIGGSLWGAYQSQRANNEGRRILNDNHNRMQAYYNARQAQDYTMRTDAQSVLTKSRDLLNEQYKRIRSLGKVGGATDEAVAMAKEGANKALADTMSTIAANGASYKEQIGNMAMQESAQYSGQQAQLAMNKGQALANAGSIMQGSGAEMMKADDWSWLMGKKKA